MQQTIWDQLHRQQPTEPHYSGRIQLSLKMQFIKFDFDVPLGQQYIENLRSKI